MSHDGTDVKKVGLVLEDGTEYPCEGTLQFRDVTVEQSTGSVILRILFPNPEQVLLPGMFVRAIVTEGVNERALMVSQQAVSRNVKGEPFVLVVNEEGKAEQRMVKLDRTIDDRWLVSEGIAEGDTVIVEGLQRVRPGAAVRAVSWVEKQAQSLAETQSSSATEKS